VTLSTDALLFGIVLLLFGVWTASSAVPDGGAVVFTGLAVSTPALVGSVVTTVTRVWDGDADVEEKT
jgi:uncharacterized membrane protein YiaA